MMPDFSRPVLAVDTGTAYLSLALQAGGRLYAEHIEAGNRQSSLILPAIGALLSEAGITAADLGALVYAQGPGAFTGLRIGAGVVQGLAAPFGTPLIGVPSLDAVAALRSGCAAVLAATDARMGEVFYAWFDTQSGVRHSPYQVGSAAGIRLPESLAGRTVCGVGNAFALADCPPFEGSPDMPTAADYLRLAVGGRYAAVSAEQAELLYVRDKVALTATEQAALRAGRP